MKVIVFLNILHLLFYFEKFNSAQNFSSIFQKCFYKAIRKVFYSFENLKVQHFWQTKIYFVLCTAV